MSQLQWAKAYVEQLLKLHLQPNLYYHNFFHTQDVTNAALELAAEEKVTSSHDLMLLETAALYHDAGYTKTYENHEEEGCRIVREVLPSFGYNNEDIAIICNMIMKTKLPSQPATLLEKILCDADLDYLGRDDFFELGDNLHRELVEYKRLQNQEWDQLQIRFLDSHQYYTESAKRKRGGKKIKHLEELRKRKMPLNHLSD